MTKAGALSSKPLLIVTSADGFAPGSDALAAALRAAGDRQTVTLHLATDHSYSDDRIALSQAVVNWLSTKYASVNKLISNRPAGNAPANQPTAHHSVEIVATSSRRRR